MKLKDLIKKINQANKLNEELVIGKKVNLVLMQRLSKPFSKPIRIFSTKDIKKITDYYIDEVANIILNSDLEKTERYLYKIVNTNYEIAIELNEF